MIKLNNNLSEVMIRESPSEPQNQAKLIRNMWVAGKQAVRTFTPDNINDYLYTYSGNPGYDIAGVGGSIQFYGDLDIIYMNGGVSCRSVSGELRGVSAGYDTDAYSAKYIMVCNFTGDAARLAQKGRGEMRAAESDAAQLKAH